MQPMQQQQPQKQPFVAILPPVSSLLATASSNLSNPPAPPTSTASQPPSPLTITQVWSGYACISKSLGYNNVK